MHVLAVCADPALLSLIEQAFADAGHRLSNAPSAAAAADIIAAQNAEILIVDADADGCENFAELRQLRPEWLPVLVLSESNKPGGLAGGDGYLTKPPSAAVLRAQIGALENLYRMHLQSLTAHRELQALLDATVDGILTTDAEGSIEAANRAVETIFGYSLAEIKGRNVSLLNAGQQEVKGKSGVEGRYYEVLGVRKNGECFPLEIDVSHYTVQDKFYYLSVMRDISERKAAEKQLLAMQKQLLRSNKKLQKLSFFDQLTGLANRRNFDAALLREFKLARREKTLLSLILCDIDFFKLYNDHYGHQAGDACLQQVAAAIGGVPRRPADLACRYGGEEFVVILPRTDAQGVSHVAEMIRSAVENCRIPHAQSKIADCVTLSLGCVTHTGLLEDVDALLKAADDALYLAKKQGRNRVARV